SSAAGRKFSRRTSPTAGASISSTSRPTDRTLMASRAAPAWKRPSVIPGFGITLGFTLTYLGLIVLIPLGGLILRSSGLAFSGFWQLATDPRTVAALKVSFGLSFIAAMFNAVFGFIAAWVLVRHHFP